VSFTVEPGAILVLADDHPVPRRALLPVLATLVRPVTGRLRIAEVDAVADPRGARPHLGLADPHALDPRETVAERIARLARWAGASPESHEDARESLAAWRDRRLGDLDPGGRSHVALETARLHRPGLLLLDRPLEAVGPAATSGLQDRLAALAADGAALVLADASMAARELADEVRPEPAAGWFVCASFPGSIAAHQDDARRQGWVGRWRVGRTGGSVRLGPFPDAAAAGEALAWVARRSPPPRLARLEALGRQP